MLLNEKHNAFHTGRDEYPKILKAAYDLAINWKGDIKGIGVMPNDGVAFFHRVRRGGRTRHRRGENEVSRKAGDLPHLGQESLCQKVPGPGKKDEDTPIKESLPTKALVNLMISEDWGDDTNH